MGIKIVKEKVMDYTFIDEKLNLKQSAEKKESIAKKDKAELDFRLRDNAHVTKLKKSKITGGHSMQGHSPVYE